MRRTYIYNKVKTVVAATLLAPCAALFFSGCSDFLDIKPQDQIIEDEFWNEKADVDNIVAGCYSALQADPIVRRMIVWGEARTENMMAGSDITQDMDLYNIFKENITAKNRYCTWDGFYNIINRCNILLQKAPQVAASDKNYTQSQLKTTLAEVTAIRALCYFYLIRTFRDVPYSTEPFTDDSQVMDLPATPFETVLDYLIADLESIKGDALMRYPENKPDYQTGRITRDAVYAMLCEMYLWKQDYQNCILYADQVIASKKLLKEEKDSKSSKSQAQSQDAFHGFPLVSNVSGSNEYGAAFKDIFVDGNSVETIFELVFDNDEAGNSMTANSAVGQLYGNITVSGRIAPSNTVTGDVKKKAEEISGPASYKVFNYQNKKKDARQLQSVGAIGTTENIFKYVFRGVTIDGSKGDPDVKSLVSAYNYAKRNNVEYWYTSANWIIYRLTDIMLLKAEALCQLARDGEDADTKQYNDSILGEAFTLVSAVNNRWLMESDPLNASTRLKIDEYKTKAAMNDLVLEERHREFLYEGKRWYDLVRRSMRDNSTVKLCQAITLRDGPNNALAQTFFSEKTNGNWRWAIFWPYYYEETNVNRNLTPNPAYSDGTDQSIK